MNKRLSAALIAAFILGGCSSIGKQSSESNPAPCPNVLVLDEASRLVDFSGDETLENVAYTGEITSVVTACRYVADRPIDVEVEVEFAFGKGPTADTDEKLFKYFVAVTRTDREVIAKQDFVIPVTFSDKKRIVLKKEEIDKIVIPRNSEETSGLNFEIVIGLSLTPKQVVFNRSGKSLKFPEIQ